MSLPALLLLAAVSFAAPVRQQAPVPAAARFFPPVSEAWDDRLKARMPGMVADVPPNARFDLLAPVAYQLDLAGLTPKAFERLPADQSRLALKNAYAAAKKDVDDRVWADIRRVSENAEPAMLEALAVRLEESVSSYGPYILADTKRIALLARDSAKAYLKAGEVARLLGKNADVAAVEAMAGKSVEAALVKRSETMRETARLPIDRAGDGDRRIAPLTRTDRLSLLGLPALSGLVAALTSGGMPTAAGVALMIMAWAASYLAPRLGGRKDALRSEALLLFLQQFIALALGFLAGLIATNAG